MTLSTVRLPHSYEAEQGLLGALLTNNRALERVPQDFRPEHFADPLHSKIFLAIREAVDRGHVANPVTLNRIFGDDPVAGALTAGQYLVKLAASVVSVVNAEDWARTITDLWAARSVVVACQEIISETLSPGDRDARRIIEDAEARIHELSDNDGSGRKGLIEVGAGVDAVLEGIEAARQRGGVSGLSTGLTDLDGRTSGLQPGSLIIAGGRPGMGKSDLGLGISFNAATQGKRVGFFSLEMSRGLLTNRLLARMTRIPATDQIGGKVDPVQVGALTRAAGDLKKLPLWIDDAPAPTVDVISSRARQLQRRHGLDLVVIDYLQLIAPGNNRRNRQTNRTEDVTMISQGLKALAKDLNVPVVALCQLSRAVESRDDKRPVLADLRESGGLEQDADVVLFVYRDSYYLERDQPKQRERESAADFAERRDAHENKLLAALNVCQVIIAKQRMGAPGAVDLYYKPAHSHFADLSSGGIQ